MIKEEYRKKIEQEEGMVAVFSSTYSREVEMSRKAHERFVIQECLRRLLGEDNLHLNRDENGAPFIDEKPNLKVSLSHSGDWFALYLSKRKNVGIDIQVFRNKSLYAGRSYFVNDQEENMFSMSDRELQIIWSAKEAGYKYRKGKVERYKEGMTVTSIAESTIALLIEEEKLSCGYVISEDYVLVYTL